MMNLTSEEDDSFEEALSKSKDLLAKSGDDAGFFAANEDVANYRRVWSRDGVINGLAALLTCEKILIKRFEANLDTLALYQARCGAIPSNVDLRKKEVSYGETVGRVDPTLVYILGVRQYHIRTKDADFLKRHEKTLEKSFDALECWEYNGRGMIYVPPGGDWADEYIQQGYVLYDQVLYHKALLDMADIKAILGGSAKRYGKKAEYVKDLINSNFWISEKDGPNTYHPAIRERALQEIGKSRTHYISSFDSTHINNRYDAFANILAILTGVADHDRADAVLDYSVKLSKKHGGLLPAFYPPIRENDAGWDSLRLNYGYEFKNNPFEYHNGGLWPMINGFFAQALASNSREKYAKRVLLAINKANKSDREGGEWGFPEFLHAKTLKPMGTRHQLWSAAGSIIGYSALKGEKALI